MSWVVCGSRKCQWHDHSSPQGLAPPRVAHDPGRLVVNRFGFQGKNSMSRHGHDAHGDGICATVCPPRHMVDNGSGPHQYPPPVPHGVGVNLCRSGVSSSPHVHLTWSAWLVFIHVIPADSGVSLYSARPLVWSPATAPHPCPRHPTCPSWAFLAVNVSTSSQWCSSQEWVGRAPISHSPPIRLLGGTTLHERGVIRSTFPRCGRVSPWLSRAHLVFVVMQPCCTLRDVSRVLHILERCVICAVVRTRWSCRHRRSP